MNKNVKKILLSIGLIAVVAGLCGLTSVITKSVLVNSEKKEEKEFIANKAQNFQYDFNLNENSNFNVYKMEMNKLCVGEGDIDDPEHLSIYELSSIKVLKRTKKVKDIEVNDYIYIATNGNKIYSKFIQDIKIKNLSKATININLPSEEMSCQRQLEVNDVQLLDENEEEIYSDVTMQQNIEERFFLTYLNFVYTFDEKAENLNFDNLAIREYRNGVRRTYNIEDPVDLFADKDITYKSDTLTSDSNSFAFNLNNISTDYLRICFSSSLGFWDIDSDFDNKNFNLEDGADLSDVDSFDFEYSTFEDFHLIIGDTSNNSVLKINKN